MVAKDLRFVLVGHVDHGKSTLIGRLLADTGALNDGALDKVKRLCEERGKDFEYAFLLDALQEEQDQGITIDTTKIEFSTDKRHYTIIDAPGHKEFLKNMISGASNAEAAVLMVDAKDGIKEQTKRHAYILSLLGIEQVYVAVNKMDLVDYSQDRFEEVKGDVSAYLGKLGLSPMKYIPISARDGDNIASLSDKMPWFKGPFVLEAIDEFESQKPLEEKPLRLPIQDVYKFDDRRIITGKIESGTIKVGDEIVINPSGNRSKVKSIESWLDADKVDKAWAGQSTGIIIEDEFFFKRGEVISHVDAKPIVSDMFRCNIFWMGKEDFSMNKKYRLKLATQDVECEVYSLNKVVDSNTLEPIPSKTSLSKHDVGNLVIKTKKPLVFDHFSDIPTKGRFVIIDEFDVCGGGIIEASLGDKKATNVKWEEGNVSREDRVKLLGKPNKVLWFTGLSGAGKSTLAKMLEKKLHDAGILTYILDGDNVRHGLNGDLGFTKEERNENIRRIAEVAKLFHDSGVYVLVSFISPHQTLRKMARDLIGEDFVEVHVDCSLEECERRDTKGLYKKARQGIIKDFTGVSAKYEAPTNAEVVLKTHKKEPEECIEQILSYLNL